MRWAYSTTLPSAHRPGWPARSSKAWTIMLKIENWLTTGIVADEIKRKKHKTTTTSYVLAVRCPVNSCSQVSQQQDHRLHTQHSAVHHTVVEFVSIRKKRLTLFLIHIP